MYSILPHTSRLHGQNRAARDPSPMPCKHAQYRRKSSKLPALSDPACNFGEIFRYGAPRAKAPREQRDKFAAPPELECEIVHARSS